MKKGVGVKRLFGRGVCMCIGHLYKIDYVLSGKEGRKEEFQPRGPAKKKEKKEIRRDFFHEKKKKERILERNEKRPCNLTECLSTHIPHSPSHNPSHSISCNILLLKLHR